MSTSRDRATMTEVLRQRQEAARQADLVAPSVIVGSGGHVEDAAAHTTDPNAHHGQSHGDADHTNKLSDHQAHADPHPQYETQAEAEARADAAVEAHEASGDPHPQYLTAGEGDAALDAHEAAADPHPGYQTAAESQAQVDAHAGTPHPTAAEKAALAGTDGAPSGANRYVTDSDVRLKFTRAYKWGTD